MAVIERREGKRGVRYRVLIRVAPHKPVSKTFKHQTTAKRWAEKTELELREGTYNTIAEARKHTVADAIDRYEKHVLPSVKRSKRDHILYWWKERVGHYLLNDVTPAIVAELRDQLGTEATRQGKQRAPGTIVRYLVTLSHIFSIALKEWQWCTNNPVAKVSKPSLPRGRIRFLDDNERERLLEACKESKNKHLYTIVVIALSTGMRRGEILNLTWKDIDLINGKILLHHTKNNDHRSVPLSGHALELVKQLDKSRRRLDTQLLFPGTSSSKPIDFRSAWRRAMRRACITDYTFHDNRHSCASYLLMNGESLAVVGEILGHRNAQTTKRYSHLSDSHRLKAVSSMNDKIFG